MLSIVDATCKNYKDGNLDLNLLLRVNREFCGPNFRASLLHVTNKVEAIQRCRNRETPVPQETKERLH